MTRSSQRGAVGRFSFPSAFPSSSASSFSPGKFFRLSLPMCIGFVLDLSLPSLVRQANQGGTPATLEAIRSLPQYQEMLTKVWTFAPEREGKTSDTDSSVFLSLPSPCFDTSAFCPPRHGEGRRRRRAEGEKEYLSFFLHLLLQEACCHQQFLEDSLTFSIIINPPPHIRICLSTKYTYYAQVPTFVCAPYMYGQSISAGSAGDVYRRCRGKPDRLSFLGLVCLSHLFPRRLVRMSGPVFMERNTKMYIRTYLGLYLCRSRRESVQVKGRRRR